MLTQNVSLCDSLLASVLAENRLHPAGDSADCLAKELENELRAPADPMPLTHKPLISGPERCLT